MITEWIVQGKTNAWIAKQLGRSVVSIGNARHRYKLKAFFRVDKKRILKAYGQPAELVARKFGCSASSVRRIWRAAGLPALRLYADPERHSQRQIQAQIRRRRREGHAAGLDKEQVKELFLDGYTDAQAAEVMGCKPLLYKQYRLSMGLKRR